MTTRRPGAKSHCYHASAAAAHREIEGQVLLLAPGESSLLTLNESGRFIWRRLLKGRSSAEIVQAFRREFRIPADRASADVQAFLDELERRRIISRTR